MQLNEEVCPVAESVLAELYRASPHALIVLIADLPTDVCASLALYCYRRAHLSSTGLAIAACCDEDELAIRGGNLGESLFARSRTKDIVTTTKPYQSREISLALGPMRPKVPLGGEAA